MLVAKTPTTVSLILGVMTVIGMTQILMAVDNTMAMASGQTTCAALAVEVDVLRQSQLPHHQPWLVLSRQWPFPAKTPTTVRLTPGVTAAPGTMTIPMVADSTMTTTLRRAKCVARAVVVDQ